MTLTVLVCDAAGAVDGLQVEATVEIGLSLDATTDATRVAELAARLRPDVVICRLDMEGTHGVEVLTRVAASSPPSRTIARIAPGDPQRAADAIAAGASGLSSVDDDPRTVLAIATAVAGGSVAMSPAIAASLARELSAATDSSAHLAGELDELRASISQGTSAKADFLSNISHELRTPVTVAKGIAYVLRNPAIEEAERTEFLEQLQGSLDKLMGIVDEIITISELERGSFELVLAEVDLAPLVLRVIDGARATHPDVPILAEVGPTLETLADEARIAGVVAELLDNACRYSPAGAPVEISARDMKEGVVVTVTDHGEGLARDVARRSFDEPFSTGEGVLRKEKAGVGVGLHLARQLVLEHGGTMWADPLPGGGTLVAFCIPPRDARGKAARAGAA
ncbi:MAG: ATP-binding protein [Actinomycetota bacterium]